MLRTTASVPWRPLEYDSSTAQQAYIRGHNQCQLRCSK